MISISSPSMLVSGGRGLVPAASAVLHANLDLLAGGAGVIALMHDLRTNAAPAACMNLHVLFGVLLWLSVIARFHRRLTGLPGMPSAKIHAFARQLSRRVYLLLYALMFLNVGFGVMHSTSHMGAIQTAEYFRPYLACGVVALVTIQCLAALCRRLGGGGNG